MGILSRFSDIMSANINDFLDKLEDKNASKMIDQQLRDVREELAQVKNETAGVLAAEKTAKRNLDACIADINRYSNGAMNAVKAGQDDDARKLLETKKNLETKKVGLQAAYDAAHEDSVHMKAMYDKLVSDVEALEARAASMKGKVAAAASREHMNKVAASVTDLNASTGFARMEVRINERLDRAEAAAQLDSDAHSTEDLLAKYGDGAPESSVEDELAQLKAQLGKQNS